MVSQRLIFTWLLLALMSVQAIAATKWNNPSKNGGETTQISKPILPQKVHASAWCKREIHEWINDFVKQEEVNITDKNLNKASNILAHEDFFLDYVNLSLYNRTISVLANPNKKSFANDLKNMIQRIGDSKFATKVNRRDSRHRLIQTDFLLLYAYAVIALDETGNLSQDEKDIYTRYIKSRINLKISEAYTFKASRCTEKFMGEDKFDVFSSQNHAFGKQHLRMLVGVLTNDAKEIEQGRKLFQFAIDDLGHTGALWREASRGAYSWTYYPHALGSLMAIGDIDRRLGGELFSYKNKKGQDIHDTVKFYLDSLKEPTNPALMFRYAKKNMGIEDDRKDWNEPTSLRLHQLAINKPFYHEWFPIYAHNFSEHSNVADFKSVMPIKPEAPEFTYHLGLNSWCAFSH